MRALLDINVLIALLDAGHVHHDAARSWMRDNIAHGWATCPITQNGAVRAMSQPGYPQHVSSALVAERLREATAAPHHRFWPDDVSLLDAGTADWERVIGPRQITDVYLLALAVKHRGRFVTFDARMAPDTVEGGPERLSLI